MAAEIFQKRRGVANFWAKILSSISMYASVQRIGKNDRIEKYAMVAEIFPKRKFKW